MTYMYTHIYIQICMYTHIFFSKDSIFYPNSCNYHIIDQMRIKDSKETNWLLLYNRDKSIWSSLQQGSEFSFFSISSPKDGGLGSGFLVSWSKWHLSFLLYYKTGWFWDLTELAHLDSSWVPLLTGHMTIGRLFKLWTFHFFICANGNNKRTYLSGLFWGLNWIMPVKVVEFQVLL